MFPNWGSSFDVVNATESYISNFMLQAVSTFPLRLWRKKKIMKTWPMMGSVHMCHTLGSTLSRIFFFILETAFSSKHTGSFTDRLGSIICSLLRKMGDDVDSHSRLRLFS